MTPRGIHALDCLIHFAGSVVSVFAHSDRRAIPVDVDDVRSEAILMFVESDACSCHAGSDTRLWRYGNGLAAGAPIDADAVSSS